MSGGRVGTKAVERDGMNWCDGITRLLPRPRALLLVVAFGWSSPGEVSAQAPATPVQSGAGSKLPVASAEATSARTPAVIVVVGAAGSDEFREPFRQWAGRWVKGAERAKVGSVVIGLDEQSEAIGKAGESDRSRLQKELSRGAERSENPLWVVLIGHGTFDGKTARFNLRGEDVTAADLREWLRPMKRPVALINCSSASAPFLTELSAADERVVISATRSGSEFNFARFGDALSSAISEGAADLDKDEQASLLEAFLYASAQTAEFYSSDTRLQTEHALLDDNGDKLGTPSEFFQGLRATKTAKSGAKPDGALASRFILIPSEREAGLSPETRAKRDELEKELARIRGMKGELPEEEYWQRVEGVVAAIARLYASRN